MQITYWLWQFDEWAGLFRKPANYGELARGVRALVPPEFEAGLMVKTHSGGHWQGDFDSGALAIHGAGSLQQLKDACSAAGVQLGAWGEAEDEERAAGELAGISNKITGYYAIDLEPYNEFHLETGTATAEQQRLVAGQAVRFWREYDRAGGDANRGVSMVGQPSGFNPFGRALEFWLLSANFIHLQDYYAAAPQLRPAIAEDFARGVLASFGLERLYIPIVEPENVEEQAALPQPNGLDVWRL